MTPQSTGPADRAEGPRCALLLGRGRSGTTWIGQILNRYPGCHYKYEPFNSGKRGGFARWLADLPDGEDEALRRRFATLCAGCAHDVEYPPFVSKPVRPQPRSLLRLSWQVGKAIPLTRRVYEWYGRPRLGPSDWVLMKQVNFPNEQLDHLARVIEPSVIAVLRNPFGSVASALRFYQANPSEPFRTAATVDRVMELLPSVAGFGVPSYRRADLEGMSLTEFEAVRWRVQTEPLVDFATRYPKALALTHEEFAADPEGCARRVYGFLGWEFDESVAAYIRETTAGEKHRRASSARRKLHGIHRDPVVATQRWRKDLTDDQVADVRRAISGSALLTRWPELT
jgi:hypothetical protein